MTETASPRSDFKCIILAPTITMERPTLLCKIMTLLRKKLKPKVRKGHEYTLEKFENVEIQNYSLL